MKEDHTQRGFQLITHDHYPPNGEQARLVQQSSTVDENNLYGFTSPGSSYLWVGENLHLNQEEVQQLIGYLQHWLETGKLFTD